MSRHAVALISLVKLVGFSGSSGKGTEGFHARENFMGSSGKYEIQASDHPLSSLGNTAQALRAGLSLNQDIAGLIKGQKT